MKFNLKIVVVLAAIIVIIVVFLVLDDEGVFEPSEYDPDYIVFSTVDAAILDSATEAYDTLKETISFDDARQQILQQLSEMDGVAKAELGVDGFTIFIEFADGDFAAVDTFELEEEPNVESGTSFLVHSGDLYHEHIDDQMVHFGYVTEEVFMSPSVTGFTTSFDVHDVDSSTTLTCSKKQVLVLAPAYWEFNMSYIEATVALFKENGWSDEDITLKYGSDRPWMADSNCFDLTPSDFFDWSEYGIVLYIGHGSVRGYKSFEEDNLFLQFCYMTNESFKMNKQFREWKEDKKLVTFGKYDFNPGGRVYRTGIRADVLREQLTKNTLPSTLVCFPVCYGSFFHDVYLDAGAQVFYSWNNNVAGVTSDENNMIIVKKMLQDVSSAYDAYADTSILKSYNFYKPYNLNYEEIPEWTGEDPGHTSAVFFLHPSPEDVDTTSQYYLPAWIDVSVSGIPGGTSLVRVKVYDGAELLCQDEASVSASDTRVVLSDVGDDMFTPTGEVRIEVAAIDSSWNELATGETTITLTPGCSSSSVTLSEKGEQPRWVICGSDDTSDLASTKLIDGGNVCITPFLNGEKIRIYPNQPQTFSCLDYWAIAFPASSGDLLTIKITSSKEPGGVRHQCGELWIYCEADVSKQMKLYDAQDFGVYPGTETERVLLWEKTYTLP